MHRILLALAATLAVTITAAGQSAMTVPDGIPVKVKLLQFISSEMSQPGDAVRFEVFEDVIVNNLVVISRHTPVVGSIGNAKAYKSSTWLWPHSSRGKLVVTITETRSVDGKVIRLVGPIVGSNESKDDSSIRWHHEGEVFDAIVTR
jgi:hypothetical protein